MIWMEKNIGNKKDKKTDWMSEIKKEMIEEGKKRNYMDGKKYCK